MNGIVFAVIVLAASVVLVAVLAWVSRRLLGGQPMRATDIDLLPDPGGPP